jgi:hypothetical protein
LLPQPVAAEKVRLLGALTERVRDVLSG